MNDQQKALASELAFRDKRRSMAKDAEFSEKDHPRDESGRFGAGGGKMSSHQEEMHNELTKGGWEVANEEQYKNNPAAKKESLSHTSKAAPHVRGGKIGGHDLGAQTYVHKDRSGEAIGTGSHKPSHGSNWSHTKAIAAGPVLSKPGEPLTQFLGGTRGRSGTNVETLREHLSRGGKIG